MTTSFPNLRDAPNRSSLPQLRYRDLITLHHSNTSLIRSLIAGKLTKWRIGLYLVILPATFNLNFVIAFITCRIRGDERTTQVGFGASSIIVVQFRSQNRDCYSTTLADSHTTGRESLNGAHLGWASPFKFLTG